MRFWALWLLLAGPAFGQGGTFAPPTGAVLTFSETEGRARYDWPLGPVTTQSRNVAALEGALDRRVWRVPGEVEVSDLTARLQEKLARLGFSTVFQCRDRACGGFDFRFGLDIRPAPEMHVDLGDFRSLSMRRVVDGQTDYVGLLVSRAPSAGYMQLTTVAVTHSGATAKGVGVLPRGKVAAPVPQKAPAAPKVKPRPLSPAQSTDLARLTDDFERYGASVLEGVVFATGSSKLDAASDPQIAVLAAFLAANPDKGLRFVGHSDSKGSFAGNLALSKKRAAAVRGALISGHGIAAKRVLAEGVADLAPRASNETEDGRALNRRGVAVPF